MPAVETTGPGPQPGTGDDAEIIPIQARRLLRGHPRDVDKRGTMHALPDPHKPGSQDRDSVLALLADDLEEWFNSIGRTLTDEETAEVFTHSLALVARMLRGAKAQGIVTDEQRHELVLLLEGMKDAARLV